MQRSVMSCKFLCFNSVHSCIVLQRVTSRCGCYVITLRYIASSSVPFTWRHTKAFAISKVIEHKWEHNYNLFTYEIVPVEYVGSYWKQKILISFVDKFIQDNVCQIL